MRRTESVPGDRQLAQPRPSFLDYRREQRATPAQLAEQAGPADDQTAEVVQQVRGFAQGDAQLGAAVTGQQAGPWAEMTARQFMIAALLAAGLAVAAGINVLAIACPSSGGQRWRRRSGLGAGRFEGMAAAVTALRGLDVVLDEDGAGRRGAAGAEMLAELLCPSGQGRSACQGQVPERFGEYPG